MFLREIVQALERIEQNQAVVLGRLVVLARDQGTILGRLDTLEKQAVLNGTENKTVNTENAADEWLQNGIDNILNYQAGKKRGEQE